MAKLLQGHFAATSLAEFLGFPWLVSAGIGGVIAWVKCRSLTEGVLLGLFLGLVGVFIESLMPNAATSDDS